MLYFRMSFESHIVDDFEFSTKYYLFVKKQFVTDCLFLFQEIAFYMRDFF